jgi:hypothetical protein
MEEAAVSRALRQHDDDLRLIRSFDLEREVFFWKVYRYNGPERPADFILAWATDDGEPKPLSMRIVDEVQRHDRGMRGDTISPDEYNRRLREERHKDYLRDAEAIVQEFGAKLDGKKTVPVHRSQRLRMYRDKRRAKGENV